MSKGLGHKGIADLVKDKGFSVKRLHDSMQKTAYQVNSRQSFGDIINGHSCPKDMGVFLFISERTGISLETMLKRFTKLNKPEKEESKEIPTIKGW